MTGWASKLNKAIKAADYIEKGIEAETPVAVENNRRAELVKHYTVYSIVGTAEKPIAWRLYMSDVDGVIATARRRMLRAHESIVEGDPMYVCTRYEAREDIWN